MTRLTLYSQKLAEIDAHYTQAGVEVDGTFPEGQAVVVGMLNEAHEIVRRLLMKCDYYKVTTRGIFNVGPSTNQPI